MLALVLAVGVAAAVLRERTLVLPPQPIRFAPSVVVAALRLEGALVRGAAANWALNRKSAVRLGDPMPVALTAYCLKGLTRRDHYVRDDVPARAVSRGVRWPPVLRQVPD
jgi:hypothetical protein